MALPLVFLASAWLQFDLSTWAHLWETLLPDMLLNTALLVLGVSALTLALGVSLGWLIAHYTFPGANVFKVLLVLPLAVPGYVLGFVFMGLLDYAGPIQTVLRSWLGEHFEVEIRTLVGAIIVLSLVFYPYVYLLSLSAFREQSASQRDAARAMGYSTWQTFWRVALPLARPSIAAGWMLVVMETLTDFAVVRYYNVVTLSEGVVRLWVGQMNREGGLQVASVLMAVALAVLLIERFLRRKARYTQLGGQARPITPAPLRGWRGIAASLYAGLVFTLAFGLPGVQLLLWAIEDVSSAPPGTLDTVFTQYLANTLGFALGAAALVLLVAIPLAWALRQTAQQSSPAVRSVIRLATLGYAVPGAALAVGVLFMLAPLNEPVSALTGGAVLLSGSLIGLFYGYVVRFLAIGLNSVEASLEKVSPSMEMAARSLGARTGRVLRQVYLPLLRGGIASAALLVCVDVLKELPLTMFLRPFGMETLSTWAYMLASESAWVGAATPALAIVALSILPAALLLQRMESLRTSL
ncbi:MAG: iron ABC transporter permease [Anaerolineae bacterium]|nr:iron ABC transporter permease [Anaerolineae bacterium]